MESGINQRYELSEDEIEAVNEGIAQLDQGIFLSNEEANKQASRCLKKAKWI